MATRFNPLILVALVGGGYVLLTRTFRRVQPSTPMPQAASASGLVSTVLGTVTSLFGSVVSPEGGASGPVGPPLTETAIDWWVNKTTGEMMYLPNTLPPDALDPISSAWRPASEFEVQAYTSSGAPA